MHFHRTVSIKKHKQKKEKETHNHFYQTLHKRYMKSPKTHVNKAYALVSVYKWLKTFEGSAEIDTCLNACNYALSSYANTAKQRSRYQLPPNFSEQDQINQGTWMTQKEQIVYLQWLLKRFVAITDALVAAKKKEEGAVLTKEQAWEMQRLLLVLMFSWSGGLRREVIGRLTRNNIVINADGILLSYMTREKASRQKTNEVPLPMVCKEFLEVFLQFGRPALLCAKDSETGEILDPKALWVGYNGGAMELKHITLLYRTLGQEFNPYLEITPIFDRRGTVTNTFAGRIPLGEMTLPTFMKSLSLLMNVDATVITDSYNRFSALHENVRTQNILIAPKQAALQDSLQAAHNSITELLAGRSVIPQLGVRIITRPVREILDDAEWRAYLEEEETKMAKEKRRPSKVKRKARRTRKEGRKRVRKEAEEEELEEQNDKRIEKENEEREKVREH